MNFLIKTERAKKVIKPLLCSFLCVIWVFDIQASTSDSSLFALDTRDQGALSSDSSLFAVDTRDQVDLGSYSNLFALDTRDAPSDAQRLHTMYNEWTALNVPVGMRGMNEVVHPFGISNVLAFSLGWKVDDPSTWHHAKLREVAQDGVWLRAYRRSNLPSLTCSWLESSDLDEWHPAKVLESQITDLDNGMESWDVRVPSDAKRKFYQLKIEYETNP